MKDDIKQVNDVAKIFKMTKIQRKEFGEFLETEKKRGKIGSQNDRGDFTYDELKEKAREFLKGS
jgi:hypothetical protein